AAATCTFHGGRILVATSGGTPYDVFVQTGAIDIRGLEYTTSSIGGTGTLEGHGVIGQNLVIPSIPASGDDGSMLIVGTGASVATSSPAIVIDRVVVAAVNDNIHGFTDESAVTLADAKAMNSYDARATISGVNADHIATFQANLRWSGSGTLGEYLGLTSVPVANSGIVTDLYHVRVKDCTGAGTVEDQFAFYAQAMSKGTESNWGVYIAGNDSYFGGVIQNVSALNALTDTDEPENYHLLIRNPGNDDNEGVGIAFLVSSMENDVGASIISERIDSNAKSNLAF
ncbi:MAG: hypothetical protein JRC53_02080, partial [Deltaproteobacteria bacterium]|nr:hypothetical protein [Deltaproteobacteria bacterium]